MTDYMAGGVGDAKSECVTSSKQFAIAFHGEYDPNAKPLPPLKTFVNVISNYGELVDLGGYTCSREIMENDGRIYIKLVHSGKEYKSACDGILNYLNQSKFVVMKDWLLVKPHCCLLIIIPLQIIFWKNQIEIVR